MRLALVALVAFVLGSTLAGCASLRELAALRAVDYAYAGIRGERVAGVPLRNVRSFDELSAAEAFELGAALADGILPFEADILVAASNPAENGRARLLEFDWTLFLDGRETVSGVVDRAFAMPAGETVEIPVAVRLDLLDFFDGGVRDLVRVALAISGHGQEPVTLRLEAFPTVETPFGRARATEPVVIERQAGSSRGGS